MTQRIEFIIPGPLSFDHRRVEQWYDKRGRRLPRPVIFLPREYQEFRERARRALAIAKREQGWIVPDRKCQIRMSLEYHIATQQWTKPKRPVKKNGKPNKPRLQARPPIDEDNLKKGIKDALQRDRKTVKHPVVDSRFLYINDNVVNAYPFPDCEWFVIEPGTEEWIVVALEVVGEFRLHVEQIKMALEEQF